MSNIKVSSDIDTLLRKSTKEDAATFLGLEDTKAQWGQITGTLTSQTDLVAALDAKAPTANPNFTGSAVTPELIVGVSNGDQLKIDLDGSNIKFNGNDGTGSGVGNFLIAHVNGTPSDSVSLDAAFGTLSLSGDSGVHVSDDLHVATSGAGTDTTKVGIRTKTPTAALDVDGDVKLSDFTSTSRSAGASDLNPIQNYQPATDDTITELCVDPSGNVVRGSQEATWTFTRAQLNALTSVRVNLLNSAGADKCIVVEETNWLIEVDLTKTAQATNVNLKCEMLGVNENSVATQITAANLNQVAVILKTANTNSFGLYHRDVPDLARIYRFDVPMTIRATTGTGSAGTFPDNFVNVKLKIKYRVFDKDTF